MGKKFKFREPNGSGAFEIEIETPMIFSATWKIIGGTSPFVGDLTSGTARETGNDIALIGTSLQTFFTIKNAKFADPEEGKHYDADCELCEDVGGPRETHQKRWPLAPATTAATIASWGAHWCTWRTVRSVLSATSREEMQYSALMGRR